MRGFKVTAGTGDLILNGKLDKILHSEAFNVVGETMFLVDEKSVLGRITFTKIENNNNLRSYSFMFRSLKRRVPYKQYSGTVSSEVQFDEAYESSLDFIKDIKNYNPKSLRNDVLIDDWRIVLAWYSSMKRGKKFPFSLETIENLALSILKEMMKRGVKVSPTDYKPEAKELYKKTVERIRSKQYFIEEDKEGSASYGLARVNPSGNVLGDAIDVNSVLENMKEFKLTSPWVYLVGGIVENGATHGDIDILVREDFSNLPLEFRICRQLTPELAKRVHFIYDSQFFGPFTSYVPLFDKMASKHNLSSLVSMEEPSPNNDFEIEEDFMIKPFGHPAGQGFTARTIVKFITKHRKFVEPFAGSASVFFTKKPSEVEVLNDLNDNYVFVFRAIKGLTDAEIKTLRSDFSWASKRETWHQCKANIRDKTYKSKLHRIWNFIYWSKFAYNGGVGLGAWRKHNPGHVIDIPFEQIRERLKDTKITQKDYRECIKENDAKSTFFYIDPPYYPADDPRFKSAKIGGIDMKEFEKICSSLEGNAIISLGRDKNVLDLFSKSKWAVKKIATKYGYGWQEQKDVFWPILLNFDFSKDVGSYEYETFEISDMTAEDYEAFFSTEEKKDGV